MSLHIQRENFMRVNGIMIKLMALESMFIQMELVMKETGFMIFNLEREQRLGQMVQYL